MSRSRACPRPRSGVGPTPLFESGVVVVGHVEVAHQNPFEGLAQDLVHHHPAPAPAQEEPLLGSAEKPAPGPDRGSRRSRFSRSPANPFHRRGPPGCNGCAPAPRPLPVRPAGQPRIEYGAGSDGPPGRWPQRSVSTDGTFADTIGWSLQASRRVTIKPTRLAPKRCRPTARPFRGSWGSRRFRHKGQVRAMNTTDTLRDFRRDYRNVYDLPGPLGPSPGESGMAFGARLRGVDHPPGGFHPRPGEAVRTLLSRLLFFRRRLLALGSRFMPRHPDPRPAAGQSGGSRCLSSAIISSRVSRAWFRSTSVSIVLLCHNRRPHASAFQREGSFRSIHLIKSGYTASVH